MLKRSQCCPSQTEPEHSDTAASNCCSHMFGASLLSIFQAEPSSRGHLPLARFLGLLHPCQAFSCVHTCICSLSRAPAGVSLTYLKTNEDELGPLYSQLKPLPPEEVSISKLLSLTPPLSPLPGAELLPHLKSFKKITTLQIHLSVPIKLEIHKLHTPKPTSCGEMQAFITSKDKGTAIHSTGD